MFGLEAAFTELSVITEIFGYWRKRPEDPEIMDDADVCAIASRLASFSSARLRASSFRVR